MKNSWFRLIITGILIILLTACGAAKPPIESAPDGNLVKKAIALQLQLVQKQIGQQLNAANPEFEIAGVKVNLLEPIYVNKLATYHLQGTYKVKLNLPSQEVTQEQNEFDIYLQRQIEGKTWRLLKRDASDPDKEPLWRSYLIRGW
ncbi:MAG: hypothetical protein SAL07_06565 [Oscillatoria sp. PMC 1051.18]|nr:hypothetical protein [Oscillatoria sp. PMC 1050.18]MEC5029558.1 hypothetical protein [Oscillatoria sp. PMC 1051.18]